MLPDHLVHVSITRAKELWYGDRGEPIQYGPHRPRYVPGTRRVRLKYIDSQDAVVRNASDCFFSRPR
jgi:hypothetical protein